MRLPYSLSGTVLILASVFLSSTLSAGASNLADAAAFRPRSHLEVLSTSDSRRLRTPVASNHPLSKAHMLKALSVRGGVANSLQNAFLGTIVMALIEKGVKEALKAGNLKVPAQLAGCIVLFGFMMLAEAINPDFGNAIFEALSPGAGILAKWLPVFFVPGLALLPLSPKIGTGMDVSIRDTAITTSPDARFFCFNASYFVLLDCQSAARLLYWIRVHGLYDRIGCNDGNESTGNPHRHGPHCCHHQQEIRSCTSQGL
jgi:hypothetical protein